MRNKNKCQPFKPQTKQSETDLCVIGGGLEGTIAAISAERKGAKVGLIQDRPVLGGNSSSEIWMCVRGAKGYCNKETVILSELEEENIYRNPNLSPSLWDPVSRKRARRHPNRSAPDVQEERTAWRESGLEKQADCLVFLDESSVNIDLTRRYLHM